MDVFEARSRAKDDQAPTIMVMAAERAANEPRGLSAPGLRFLGMLNFVRERWVMAKR